MYSNIHPITFIQYIHPSSFAEVPLHFLIAGHLSGKHLSGVPCRESNLACHTARRHTLPTAPCSIRMNILFIHKQNVPQYFISSLKTEEDYHVVLRLATKDRLDRQKDRKNNNTNHYEVIKYYIMISLAENRSTVMKKLALIECR
jgi:hypothetical protein